MAEETDAASDVAIQTELAPVELPEYHGRKPSGMKTKVSGYWTRVGRLHKIDDQIVAVVVLRVKGDGHEKAGDQVNYFEAVVLEDGFELVGKTGTRLLSTLREAHGVTADRKGKGKVAIADVDRPAGVATVTDGSGVVLTPEEIAEQAADPLRAIVDPGMTPVVVIFSDGERQLWPDEFDTGDERPKAGDRFEDENSPAGYVYAATILDADSGETLAEWTAEQEDERLRALEAAAEADEAVPDPLVLWRFEMPDGSALEAATGLEGGEEWQRAVRVLGFTEAGIEHVLKDRDDVDDGEIEEAEFHAAGCVLSDDHEDECRDADGTVLVIGGNAHAAGCVLDDAHTGDCLDAGGFALTGATTAAERAGGEPVLPLPEDFAFVDRKVPEVVAGLAEITDVARLDRLAKAEERGRGRDLKPRAGIFEALERRRQELTP